MAKKLKSFAELRDNGTQFKRTEVEVEEWGTTVFVSQLSGRQQQSITDRTKGRESDDFNIEDMASILAMALQDKDGGHPEVEWLMEQPFPVLNSLTQKTLEINGLTESAQQEIEKN